ncbi:MAG: ribose-5-phosphate isomerase A [Coriobacteriia bacterium]|nr:ribose-5-phosphate isomerase A [Coriobacteriia bacterium]
MSNRHRVVSFQSSLTALGGEPTERVGYRTDNGNIIVDVTGLDFGDPQALELRVVALPGVVECGIFAHRPADVLLVGTAAGVRRMERGRGGE